MSDVMDLVGVPDDLFRTDDEETQEQRHERAYVAFCHMPRKHAHGWAVRLHDLCGVPVPTLRKWRKEHQWDLRFGGEMARLHPELEKMGQAILWAGMGRVGERLLDIIDYGSDRDANAAIKTWSEMTGMTVRKPAQSPTSPVNINIDVHEVREYAKLSVEELFSQVKGRTQDQLDDTLALRAGKVK
jgi:hypothetical protein